MGYTAEEIMEMYPMVSSRAFQQAVEFEQSLLDHHAA
jgi:hypothetical protein